MNAISRDDHRRRMLFVSTRYLFPVDSGGKIRTTQILRGLKGGRYSATLVSPAPPDWRDRHGSEIVAVCDRFVAWPEPRRHALFHYTRLVNLVSRLPVPVATDRSQAGMRTIATELAQQPDIFVLDFAHAAVLVPPNVRCPTVVFTHNLEAEIFQRHSRHARQLPIRALWLNQHGKMMRFEGDVLRRADGVVAVSERDAQAMRRDYGCTNVATIRTGVDLEFFTYGRKPVGRSVVFMGAMDWMPNADGIRTFLTDVWPLIVARVPDATMTVVGRAPPQGLVRQFERTGSAVRFTGLVDDVRPYVRESAVFVIPLRIGGGTRLKVYEAMALGCPVVSTPLGVEGLPVEPDTHCLTVEIGASMAEAIVRLLCDTERQESLSRAARTFVEQNCSFCAAASDFEAICNRVVESAGASGPAQTTVAAPKARFAAGQP